MQIITILVIGKLIMKRLFEVGDLVRCVSSTLHANSHGYYPLLDEVITITSVSVILGTYYVRFYDQSVGWSENSFELVKKYSNTKDIDYSSITKDIIGG